MKTCDPYTQEVMRIIRKAYRKKVKAPHGIVLVSKRFRAAAREELNRINIILGVEAGALDSLYFMELLVIAIPWLGDYEFEIRPKSVGSVE